MEKHKLFDLAIDAIIANKKCSLSFLQDHFNIGVNSASKLLDELEAARIVSEFEGSSNRRVLILTPDK